MDGKHVSASFVRFPGYHRRFFNALLIYVLPRSFSVYYKAGKIIKMLPSPFYAPHLTENLSAEQARVRHVSIKNRSCQGSCQNQPSMTVKSMYVLVSIFIFAFALATWLWYMLVPVAYHFMAWQFLKWTRLPAYLCHVYMCDSINYKKKWPLT